MSQSLRKQARFVLGLVVVATVAASSAYFLGCGGGAGGGRGVGTIVGYVCAEVRTSARTLRVTDNIMSTCDPTPPPGFTAVEGYLVYLDDTTGEPDAITGANGFWSIETVPGRHTVYICAPSGPPPLLSFEVTVLAGQQRCEQSHQQGGG
ncbi:MAG: hypothetical protein ACE5O2_02215 [Armatimonadota bacterium]